MPSAEKSSRWQPHIGEPSSSPTSRWTSHRSECSNSGEGLVWTPPISGSCDTEKRVRSDNPDALLRSVIEANTVCRSFVVRESCYPFYEPSYTELPNGCSQEVQSFKKWQKEVAVRVLRTQERRRT